MTGKLHLIDHVEICSDCLLFHESGDMSYLELESEQEQTETMNRLEAGAKALRENNQIVSAKSSEEYEPFFSWNSCDICDSKLGGTRHEATILEWR